MENLGNTPVNSVRQMGGKTDGTHSPNANSLSGCHNANRAAIYEPQSCPITICSVNPLVLCGRAAVKIGDKGDSQPFALRRCPEGQRGPRRAFASSTPQRPAACRSHRIRACLARRRGIPRAPTARSGIASQTCPGLCIRKIVESNCDAPDVGETMDAKNGRCGRRERSAAGVALGFVIDKVVRPSRGE